MSDAPRAWDGLKVVEIGQHIAAAYCTKLLADLGADVVKVEPPGRGDPLRAWGPFPGDEPDPERSALFQYLNANKRSVTLDLRADRDAVLRLVAAADVVVENLRAGTLERLGLGLDAMRAANPRVVLVRVSNFGQTGPYRDAEASGITLQASAGLMAGRGLPDREPVMAGGRLPEYVGGVYAAVGALTGLLAVRQRGEAVEVDLSLQESTAVVQPWALLMGAADRWAELPVARSPHSSRPGIVPCKDGYVGINCLTGQQWADACTLLGVPEYEDRQIMQPGANADEFYSKIRPWLDERTAQEVFEEGQLFRVPTAPIGNGKTLPEYEQLRVREFYVRHPWAEFTQPSFPYRFSATPASLRRPAPRLGEHTDEVLAEAVATSPRESPAIAGAAGDAAPLLQGLRVVDLTTFWSGPLATEYLATLGADVIKVESIQRPDGFRPSVAPPPGSNPQWYEMSRVWQGGSLDKRGITLDLSQPEGMAILERLIAGADVLCENFSPRVIDNFGLGYEAVKRIKPDIVYLRSPGYGLEGPWRDYVGWAMAFEQASGMAQVTGYPDFQPLSVGGACDATVAMHNVVALLTALEHRGRTGEGQMIEVVQVEVAACLTAEQVIEHSLSGRIQSRTGNRMPGNVQGAYPCAGTNRWVAIAVRNDGEWAGLVRAMGEPDWTRDRSLQTQDGRVARHDELDERIREWTRPREHTDVVETLRREGVPVSDVITGQQVHGDPQIVDRRLFQELVHPVNGPHPFPVWPMTFSFGERHCHTRAAPTLGQHNEEVLGGELGLSAQELQALRDKQVIGDKALHW